MKIRLGVTGALAGVCLTVVSATAAPAYDMPVVGVPSSVVNEQTGRCLTVARGHHGCGPRRTGHCPDRGARRRQPVPAVDVDEPGHGLLTQLQERRHRDVSDPGERRHRVPRRGERCLTRH
ncbi:hypothetical protein ABT143_20885 [Streptomyces sp. NPDC002033]|uniref:hypothetical protein n=1 Tax=Streptomyces sp. NPDC002033 TaxID=3154533 RepID=UPI003327B36B